MDWKIARKEFQDRASAAKPGDEFRIKLASHWELTKGWGGHYWIDAIFLSYDGKEAIFENKYSARQRKVWVNFNRQIKTGEVKIIWEMKDIFQINNPTDLKKNNIINLWNPGELYHYK